MGWAALSRRPPIFRGVSASQIRGDHAVNQARINAVAPGLVDTAMLKAATARNLGWATAYNLIAIPVAAGLFIRIGLDLPMSVGAVAMSLSTIIVAANAQLLRRLKLQH